MGVTCRPVNFDEDNPDGIDTSLAEGEPAKFPPQLKHTYKSE
jgi:hypothetical protein